MWAGIWVVLLPNSHILRYPTIFHWRMLIHLQLPLPFPNKMLNSAHIPRRHARRVRSERVSNIEGELFLSWRWFRFNHTQSAVKTDKCWIKFQWIRESNRLYRLRTSFCSPDLRKADMDVAKRSAGFSDLSVVPVSREPVHDSDSLSLYNSSIILRQIEGFTAKNSKKDLVMDCFSHWDSVTVAGW